MTITFGAIVIKSNKILLVRERSLKSAQLEKWNLVSGTFEESSDRTLSDAVQREVMEECGVTVSVEGLVAGYLSVTPVDKTLYLVFGCKAESEGVTISDDNVLDARYFDLERFWNISNDEIVHEDMKLVTKNFLEGTVVAPIQTVTYT